MEQALVAIAVGGSTAVWRRFCEVIGRADLTRDPEFATTAAWRDRRDEIAAIIQAWTGPRLKAEVVSPLTAAGVPAVPAPDPGQHNEEVFVGLLGHTRDELVRWAAGGVI